MCWFWLEISVQVHFIRFSIADQVALSDQRPQARVGWLSNTFLSVAKHVSSLVAIKLRSPFSSTTPAPTLYLLLITAGQATRSCLSCHAKPWWCNEAKILSSDHHPRLYLSQQAWRQRSRAPSGMFSVKTQWEFIECHYLCA